MESFAWIPYAALPIAFLAIPALFPNSRLGRMLARVGKSYAARIGSHARATPARIRFPRWHVAARNAGVALTLAACLFLPILIGSRLFVPLARLAHPNAIAVLPRGGEYAVIPAALLLLVISLTTLSTLLAARSKDGGFWQYVAARAARDGRAAFDGSLRVRDAAVRHAEIEDLAGRIDVAALARQNLVRQGIALLVCVIATVACAAASLRMVAVVDEDGIHSPSLAGASRSIAWKDAASLSLSAAAERANGKIRAIPSMRVEDGNAAFVELWGGTMADASRALSATCAEARARRVPIVIAPGMESAFVEYGRAERERILSVISACSSPAVDCESDALPGLRALLCDDAG